MKNYTVKLQGHHLGSKLHNKRELIGKEIQANDEVYSTIEEAKDNAKRLNKLLSKGEKGYYKMKYIVIQIENGIYC